MHCFKEVTSVVQPIAMIFMSQVTQEYAMTYVCTARNEAGEIRHSVTVAVRSASPTIEKIGLEKSVREGDSLRFDCPANGSPQPKLVV